MEEQMKKAGVHVHANSLTEKVERDADTGKLTYFTKDGQAFKGFDVVLMAVGEGVYVRGYPIALW